MVSSRLSISLQFNFLGTHHSEILELLTWDVILDFIENILTQTCDKTLIVWVFLIWVVNDFLHVGLNGKTSHCLDDGLSRTAVPFRCSCINEHQSPHFLFYQLDKFETRASNFVFLHSNFFHQWVLLCWNSATTHSHFSLSMGMFVWVKFFPFFPRFVEVVVLVTILCLLFFNKQFRTQKDPWGKNALFRVVKFEWLTNNSCNRSVVLSNSHKNRYFLFFVAYETPSAVQWVNP